MNWNRLGASVCDAKGSGWHASNHGAAHRLKELGPTHEAIGKELGVSRDAAYFVCLVADATSNAQGGCS